MNMHRKRYARIRLTAVMTLIVILCAADSAVLRAKDSIRTVRVAIFQGDGVGPSAEALLAALQAADTDQYAVCRMVPDEIRDGKLSDIDVLVHPGGSGSRQGKALGPEGRSAVIEFVKNGGGYLGVCAGAYLATNDYTWSLNLIDAKCVDRKHWARGTGSVALTLSPTACTFFGHTGEQLDVYYGQGPLLGRREWDDLDVPNYQSLAIYDSEIAEKGAPAGVMKGTSAVVRARYHAGRVFCFSPHPEKTEGLEYMIPTAVRWLAQTEDEHEVESLKVTRVVRKHVPEDSTGGIAVLVTRGGNVLHRKGDGFVKGRPLTTRSPLSLASVTKQFAAMCAVILMEEGRLHRTQKVSHYLPDLNLPVQDLLWHISGLPNFIAAKEKLAIADFRKQRGLDYLTNKTHAEWLTTMNARRPPGQEFEYTNSGDVLLTRVIEVITGESFHDFQKRRIFDVLKLEGTAGSSSRFNGSGNIKTTLLDYNTWDQALWNQDSRLLSKAGCAMLFQQGHLDNGEPLNYGMGWRVSYHNQQLVTAEHGGVDSGTTAARNLVRRHFADQTTVAIFAQENRSIGRCGS